MKIVKNAPEQDYDVEFLVVEEPYDYERMDYAEQRVNINLNSDDICYFAENKMEDLIKEGRKVESVIDFVSRYIKVIIFSKTRPELVHDKDLSNLAIVMIRKTLKNMGLSNEKIAYYRYDIERNGEISKEEGFLRWQTVMDKIEKEKEKAKKK